MAVDETHLTQIYSALDDLRGIGRTQGETLAAMAQHVKDQDIRLFGGNGQPVGIIQYLATADQKNADEIKAVKDAFVADKAARGTKTAYVVGYAAGAGFAGGLLLKAITFVKTGHF